ncbi:MAG: ATP-binding protein [Mariprofundaceae bacterium]|nr:ATP-binding protein [Mariprofundaceae bacterium]
MSKYQHEQSKQSPTRVERSLSRFLLFFMAALICFALINFLFEAYVLVVIQLTVFMTLPILYVWFKRDAPQRYIKHALGFATLTVFLPLLFTPSIENTSIYWVFTYPLLAFFFLGVRTGIQWTSIYSIALCCLLALAYLDYIPLYYSWVQVAISLLELLFCSIISHFFVSDNEEAEQKQQAHVHYLKSLDRIERALHSQLDISAGMKHTLQSLLDTFQCSRAWLIYPCDAHAATWSVPFECTVDAFPGTLATGHVYGMDGTMRHFFKRVQYSDAPICLDDRNHFLADSSIAKTFSIQSQITIALRPNKEQTWLLGLHQCDNPRHWSNDEQRLFQDIARRMEDSLQHMLLYQNLKKSTHQLAKANKQAEAASHAKSEFLSIMSHELRTPLHGIIGLQELIAADEQYLTDEQREHLALAQQAAKSLGDLVNDILNLSKVESGKLELNNEMFSLKEVMLDAIAPFVIACRYKKIPLHLHLDGVPEYIMGDPIRLRQVLINLIGNAVKFTPEGMINISVTKKAHELSFTIQDTGIGISPNMLKNIFEPFRQEMQFMQQQHTGTGLGTTIAKRFVELMGGYIQVSSTLSVGSQFTFHIPYKESQGHHIHWHVDGTQTPTKTFATSIKKHPQHPSKIAHKMRILLAEDDPIGQLIAAKRLKRTGMHVDIAADGLNAWNKTQAGQYDLLLSDIRMPSMSGIELTRRIRQYEVEHQRPRLPIIGLSAHALAEVEQECLEAGMDAFLSKPIDPDSVLLKIEQILQEPVNNQGDLPAYENSTHTADKA